MSKLAVLIRKELLEHMRNKKTLIICVVLLFVAIASPIIAKIMPELLKSLSVPGMSITAPDSTNKDSLDQFIKNISQIALLVMVFVVAGVVSDEKSKKTLEIVMTKPISREKFILSKFMSSFLVISLAFVTASAIFYAYTASVFTALNLANFSIVALSVLLYMLMIVSVTILASTIVKNSIVAGGIGFVAVIAFGTLFGLFEGLKQFSPSWIFSNYQLIAANGWNNGLGYPLIINVGVIVVAVVTAIILFKRQEIDR